MLALYCAIVVAFDILAATISRMGRIAYQLFAVPQAAMYGTLGYQLFGHVGIEQRFFNAILLVAFCEATIGWACSWWIGPGKPAAFDKLADHVKTTNIAGGVAIGVTFGLIFGYTGAFVAKFLPAHAS